MKKDDPAATPTEKALLESLEQIEIKLHDIDTKLNHLIKNLRRFNGYKDSHNNTLDHFLD